MRTFACFSFSIGAVLGLGLANQILNGSFVQPIPKSGPSVSVAAAPLRVRTTTVRAQKFAPVVKAKVRKRTYRKRNRTRTTRTAAEKSISQLVSAGLSN
jgi:hypothetical protein